MNEPQDIRAPKNTVDFKGKTFLVVEDEDHNFAYIREILKRTGALILRAADAQKALELFMQQKIDLVLMDIKLPGMDGYKATQEIKKLNPKVPVIAQTAYAMINEKKQCLEAGCNDYISKPYDPASMLEIIARYL
jgi:CheY-like chemotaxis protein